MTKMRSVMLAIGTALALAAAAAPAAHAEKSVTVKGSDTMVILGQRWAEMYMGAHTASVIQVTGGGSGVGIAALINGTTDICAASRPMKDDEKLKLRDRFQTMGTEIPVAKDGLTVYLNDANPVKELTVEQLRAIYTGTITNWKEVGGSDQTIMLYGRESSSGTYVFFKDNVLLGKDFTARCQMLPGTAGVVNAVAKDPRGVGYGGAAYAKGVKDCGVRKDAAAPAVLPTLETVENGTYPLWRHLYFYTRTKPAGEVKAFIDWALSEAGQKVVTEVGYFPVK